mgnify:CR=1 FL=1
MPLPATLAAAGSVIGGLGGVIGGATSAKQSRRNLRAQIKHNREMAEYAYSKNLEQWHRQNEYNSPENQMARLRAAGINPKTVIGGSGATGNTAATLPAYQEPRTDFSKRQASLQALGMLGQFQDFQMKNAQIDMAKAERDIKEFHRDWMLLKSPMDMGGGKISMRPNAGRLYDTQLQIQQARQRQILQDTKLRFQSTKIKELEKDWLNWMKGAGIGSKLGIPLLRMFIKP